MKHKFSFTFASLPIICSIMFAMVVPVRAFQTGIWNPTGNMTMPRLLHTATLLPDGRVLVIGGITLQGRATATAELYNPSQGSWSATTSMSTPRSQHTATLLLDGRVLTAGGSFQGASLATAEIFNPATSAWSSTGNMKFPRSNHVATRLFDGRVLVTGGVGGDNGALVENSAEIYDPQTGIWTSTEHMVNARYNHQATLLNDGRVLVTGGFNSSSFHVSIKSAEIYDPATNKWNNVKNMLTPRATHLSFLLQDGRVLVAGGWTQPPNVLTATATAEIYDPSTNLWIPTGPMSLARGAISLVTVMLVDGNVLVAGGRDANTLLSTVDLYDPVHNIWSLTDSMEEARSGSHTATVLADGKVLVAGGRGTGGGPLSTAELYTP